MNIGRIKLRHLHALVAVAQHGHLTRAAQSMAVTQPAVSKTLMELEDILGTPVLVRSSRGVSLTPQGELLVRHAGTALRAVRDGLDALGAVQAQVPPVLAVGLLPTAAGHVLPAAVARYRETFPRGRLKVITATYSELLDRLKRGELDVVLGRQPEPAEMTGLGFEPLYTEPMLMVVRPGHPLLHFKRALLLPSLGRYPMLLPSEGTIIRRTADAFLLGHAVEAPLATVETVNTSFARAYALASDSVWFVPAGVVEADLRAGTLVNLPLVTGSTLAAVGLTLQSGAERSPALEALVAAIRTVAAGTRPARRRATSAATPSRPPEP